MALSLIGESAAAQATTRPGWLPRRVEIRGEITAAQRATALARLEAIERILRQVPEIANPKGFEILPVFQGGSFQLGATGTPVPGSVIEYRLMLYFFAPSKKIAGEGCTCLWVSVNAPTVAGPGGRDAQGRVIYVERERGAPRPPALQVYGTLSEEGLKSSTHLLFASADAHAWSTVSRQEYYDAMRFEMEGKGGEKLAAFRASLTKTPYDAWMEGAADRKEIREQQVASAERSRSAAEVEKFRALLEQTERDVAAQFKASEAGDRERGQAALTASHDRASAFATELAAMTPAERAMPAIIDNALTEGPIATGNRMSSVDSPKAWRVLTPNYDFWRGRTSPVDVRSVTVNIEAVGTGLTPALYPVLLQVNRTLDWAAFNRMLATPR